MRGRHAHKNLQQVIVCLQGQFKLLIDDGLKRSKFVMKTGDPSILINSLVWRELSDFSDDAVVLVLASEHYDEADYIRDYEHFLRCKMSFIHETSDVQSTNIGQNTNIWQYCVVLKGAKIGKDCNICSHVFIENDVEVADHVTIKAGVQLWDGVKLEFGCIYRAECNLY